MQSIYIVLLYVDYRKNVRMQNIKAFSSQDHAIKFAKSFLPDDSDGDYIPEGMPANEAPNVQPAHQARNQRVYVGDLIFDEPCCSQKLEKKYTQNSKSIFLFCTNVRVGVQQMSLKA